MVWGEKWGKNRTLFSAFGSFAVTFPPAIPLPFPLFSSLSERSTGRIYNQNQAVLFKIEAFPGEIIPCTGQERGEYQGGNGAKSGHILRIFARRIALKGAEFGEVWGMEISDFCTKDTPEREKIGGCGGGKMGTKKGP